MPRNDIIKRDIMFSTISQENRRSTRKPQKELQDFEDLCGVIHIED